MDSQRIAKSPLLLFMASRYTSYGLNFVRGLIVASALGPELFGVWGFLMLMQQYLLFTSFGLQYAVTVELATQSGQQHKADQRAKYIGAVLTMTALISGGLLMLAFGLQASNTAIFARYSFGQYAFILSLTVGLYHFQQVFTNIYRVYGGLTRIAAVEFLNAIMLLAAVLLFAQADLIRTLLLTMALASLFSLVIFIVRAPFTIQWEFNPAYWRSLLMIGLPLLIYNLSFNLITMASRTIVGGAYSVEAMGYYSLANMITTATILGLKSIGWVIFPDILAKTHRDIPDSVAISIVQKVNDLYGTSVFIVVFGMIMVSPLIFWFLPQYQPAEDTLAVLLLSQAILSLSFGYNSVAIARKQQLGIACIAIIATIVVAGLSFLASRLDLDLVWIALAVLLGAGISTVWQARFGARLLGQHLSGDHYLRSVLPWGSLIATLILLAGILLDLMLPASVIASGVFGFANWRQIQTVGLFVMRKVYFGK